MSQMLLKFAVFTSYKCLDLKQWILEDESEEKDVTSGIGLLNSREIQIMLSENIKNHILAGIYHIW